MSARKCDCSEKLVAWLDGELPIDEAAYLEQHLGACLACRSDVEAYKKVSVAVQAYWHAASSSGTHRVARLRVLAYIGAAAAAAVLAFFLLRPQPRVLQPAVQPAPAASSAVAVPDAKPTSPTPSPSPQIKPVHVRHSAKSPQSLPTNWSSADSAVQIAIPAEALFPAGAVPQGVAFVVDLSIAPDGSPQRLHLEPQLIQFERSR